MAESRGSLIAKSVQKHAGRAREKILQNLGKVDRTADDMFDDHLNNFTKQQNAANRLQKEFNNYIRCVRACQAASKSFLEAVSEVYEPSWAGHTLLYDHTQSVDMLYQDFAHKLGEQVLLPLNTYQSQFPEMKKKIDKRGRKLVDYDAQRHNYQALQASMAKKRDDAKLTRGRELLEEAKRTYEMLNSELHDELPALFDSRILFLVTNLQTLFNTEQVFHSETSKVYSELEAILDKLATDSQRGSYSIKKTNGASLPRKIVNDTSMLNSISPIKSSMPESPTATINNSASPSPTTEAPPKPAPPGTATATIMASPPTPPITPSTPQTSLPSSECASPPRSPPPATLEVAAPVVQTLPKLEMNGSNGDVKVNKVNNHSEEKEVAKDTQVNVVNNSAKHVEELYDIPVGASTDNLPPGVLYRVKATYKYNREDVDELSFDVGETIQVIEYDDPEEQEEGWLMGVKETTGEKGMFPANFTKPL